MANEAGKQGQGQSPATTEALSPEPRAELPARRAYTSPRLTRLGEVRDLTFGAAGSNTETAVKRLTPGRAPPAPPR